MIYNLPILGKILLRIITKFQGGDCKSKSLRRFYQKKYKTIVGLYTYGGCFKKDFNTGGTVYIGRYCSIANNVHYFGANHPMSHLCTSAIFYNRKLLNLEVNDVDRNTLHIGNDVWIGYGVIITSSCHRIGTGAVIGAGTIVTKDVPDYSIVVGNPGKVIRYRFNNETINEILNSRYWELTPKTLMKYYEDFNKPNMVSGSIFNNKIINK